MTPMAIAAMGMVTSVGLNTAQTLGSVRTGLSRPQEIGLRDAGGEFIRVCAAPLATGLGIGMARLIGLGLLALDECAAGETTPLPLVLCCPDEEGIDPAALVHMLAKQGAIELAEVQIVRGGHAAIGSALLLASDVLRAHAGCYVGAVDTLLDRGRLDRLVAGDRVLSEDNPDGFLPGEGAGFLRLTSEWRAPASVQIAGVAVEDEEATRSTGRVTGRAQARAARAALAAAGARIEDIGLIAADLTGERHRFYEAALMTARLRPSTTQTLDRLSLGTALGEVGCALGALSVAYLATAVGRGWTAARAAMYVGADDSERRTAVVVQKPRARDEGAA